MSTSFDPIVIVGSARTPMGGFQGDLKDADRAATRRDRRSRPRVDRAGLAPDQIDEVVFGCVLPAGQGQAPARQAALGAGLPNAAGCTTINKMCGSGMKAAMFAHDLILAGSAKIVVAGGMESMTNAPYLLDRARGGYRMGHGRVIDHMFLDGLEDAYDKGRLMGTFAEDCAADLPVYARGAGRLRHRLADARAEGHRGRQFRRPRSRRSPSRSGKGRDHGRAGRTAGQGAAGQDPQLEAGLPRGRHGDGGQFQFDLRWRGGAGAHARAPRPNGAASRRWPRSPATPPMRRRRACSPPRRLARSGSCWNGPAGRVDEVDLFEINEAFAVVADGGDARPRPAA